ncbi:MAG TPA: hypothetical protein VNT03_20460 [Baekduia sp.]|nr:hypothetical protein [Baekduia sp.]
MGKQAATVLGQLHASGDAVEQRRAEVGLQFAICRDTADWV